MIFYGTNGKHFATLELPQASCPACQRPGQLAVALVGRYAHVYWVPFFPYQKLAVVQCQACGSDWAATAVPPTLAPAVRELKKSVSHPLWMWSGLALLVVALLGGYFYGIHDSHNDEALLATPQAGDIYTVRSDSANMYSLLKVRRVGGNGVELVANQFQTPDSNPIATLNQDSSYNSEPFIITRLDLQIMRRKGELTDVDRP